MSVWRESAAPSSVCVFLARIFASSTEEERVSEPEGSLPPLKCEEEEEEEEEEEAEEDVWIEGERER